jgi:hypothetical protein
VRKRRAEARISVVIPARDEERTVADPFGVFYLVAWLAGSA